MLAAAIALPFSARAEAPASILLGISSSTLAYGGLRIAEHAGLFEKNGIAPRIVVMDSGNAAITATIAGSAQFAAAGPGEALAARVHGQDIVILVNLYRGLSGSLILSKAVAAKLPDPATLPVAERIRLLDGLSIAEPSATSAYLHPFRSAAESAHVTLRFVYMTQPAMVAALTTGAIQGMVAGAPFSQAAVANGAGVMWISGPRGDLPDSLVPASSTCVQTTRDYARDHPDIIGRMRAVFEDLARLIQAQPDVARAALAKGFPQLDPATIDSVFRDEAANWSRPAMTTDDMRREIAIQESSGALKGVAQVDPASLLLS